MHRLLVNLYDSIIYTYIEYSTILHLIKQSSTFTCQSQVNFSDPERSRHPKSSYHWYKQYIQTELKATDTGNHHSKDSDDSHNDGKTSGVSHGHKGIDDVYRLKCSVANIWSCTWTDLLFGAVQSSNHTYISLSW